MPDLDWWAPFGTAGELRVQQLVADPSLRTRALRTEDVQEIPLARFALAGRDLVAEVGSWSYVLRDGDRTVLRFVVTPDQPWRAEAAGVELEMDEAFVDLPRTDSGKVDQVHLLRLDGPDGARQLYFTGGRLAGERLVLVRGELPGGGEEPVVTCVPAPRTREMPRSSLRRRQPADVDVIAWTAEATPAEVALVELAVLSGRHVNLDYLPAGFVGAVRTLGSTWRVFTPLPEPLPTRHDS